MTVGYWMARCSRYDFKTEFFFCFLTLYDLLIKADVFLN
ncbi:hypothetical protein HJ01_00264 [Flavobacterium frigoris PS1]|uniref:Uncharacterized protein n=1 Tax=Flavobacterium frigoris (strain PS1) TaxID=1086011 RepID=H7FM66_FLAFP|nr:hypothetical protein HJ01_00264 [Flavobacterium frigoris PS1]